MDRRWLVISRWLTLQYKDTGPSNVQVYYRQNRNPVWLVAFWAGIGFPLHWLEAAAATDVNAVGSLLFVCLDLKRSLCLAWLRALATALIIFFSLSESSARSLRLYSRINDYPKSDLSASRICFCLSVNNFSPFSSEA